MTKLWENPSPTSAFAAQNITLSSSDYDFLLVLSRFDTGGNTVANSVVVEKTNSAFVISYNYQGTSSYSRTCSITSGTTIACGDGYAAGQITNSACIPIVIYGFKKQIPMSSASTRDSITYEDVTVTFASVNAQSNTSATASAYTNTGTPFSYCVINTTNAWLGVCGYDPVTRRCSVMNYATSAVGATITIRVLFK